MKQKTFNRILVAVILILGILWGVFISRMVRKSIDIYEEYENRQERLFLKPQVKEYETDNVIISHLCLLPVSVPVHERKIVYASLIDKLIWCESRGDKYAIGKAGEKGILQFMPETFKHFCMEKYGLTDDIEEIFNEEIQKHCADLMIIDNRLFHWACSKKI